MWARVSVCCFCVGTQGRVSKVRTPAAPLLLPRLARWEAAGTTPSQPLAPDGWSCQKAEWAPALEPVAGEGSRGTVGL